MFSPLLATWKVQTGMKKKLGQNTGPPRKYMGLLATLLVFDGR